MKIETMTTQTIDTTTVKQGIDLIDYASHYTTLRREAAQELAGPCPKCGGDDRFHVAPDWFMCRQCHPKRGDAIEFIMWKDGTPFKEAVAILTNAPMLAPATKRVPSPKRQAERPPDWQDDTDNLVKRAHWRLFDDDDAGAQAARAYLDKRGLDPHTWQIFMLGYAPAVALPGTWNEAKREHIYPKQPAITIPWYRGRNVIAVGYRFLEDHIYTDVEGKPRKTKKSSLFGGDKRGVLYGGQALDTGIIDLSTLIICEGELNACSIWQVAHNAHIDVLSLGSESATITPAMVAHAGKYATVLTWLDGEEYVKKSLEALPMAYGIKSPLGQDANDLLRTGELGGFLAMHRFQAARNRYEQQRLYFDLVDAAQMPGGADDVTASVIADMAKTLRMQVTA